MGSDVEITIAIRGGVVDVGTTRLGAASGAPAPDPGMSVPGQALAGAEAPAPSPAGDFGAVGTADTSLPVPVPLDQIERLGTTASSTASIDDAPTPEGGPA